MTHAQRARDLLWSLAPRGAGNAAIAEHLGTTHQTAFMLTQDLMRKDLIRGEQQGRTWIFYAVEGSAETDVGATERPSNQTGTALSPAGFEARARDAARKLAAVPRIVVPTHLHARATRRRLAELGGAIGVRMLTFDRLYAEVLDAAGRWYVPDPAHAGDLEKLRERSLLREFREYVEGRGRLKVFRGEAVRAGFRDAWRRRDYAVIVAVARRLPERVLQRTPIC